MEEGLQIMINSFERRDVEYINWRRFRGRRVRGDGRTRIDLRSYGLEGKQTELSTGRAQIDAFTV